MPGSAIPVLILLRTSLLALLVLGMVVRPALNLVGELHAVEHAAFAQAGDHGHDLPDDRDSTPGPDHATGAHGLMHQADTGTSAVLWTTWVLPPASPPASVLPMPDSTAVRPQQPSSPFRPPIA